MKKTSILLFILTTLTFSLTSSFACNINNDEQKLAGGVSGGGKVVNDRAIYRQFHLLFKYHLPEVEEVELRNFLYHYSRDEKIEILNVVKKTNLAEQKTILIQQFYY